MIVGEGDFISTVLNEFFEKYILSPLCNLTKKIGIEDK
jgi:hypothetical protein